VALVVKGVALGWALLAVLPPTCLLVTAVHLATARRNLLEADRRTAELFGPGFLLPFLEFVQANPPPLNRVGTPGDAGRAHPRPAPRPPRRPVPLVNAAVAARRSAGLGSGVLGQPCCCTGWVSQGGAARPDSSCRQGSRR
jgi:hypothetical protein